MLSRSISSLFLACALAGCTALAPAPQKTTLELKTRSLDNVVAAAEKLRESYLSRAYAQKREERIAGLGLIGLGLVAGDLAMRGAGQSEVLGLGLAGVGLHTSNNWANPRAEALVYVEGAGGIQCALTAMAPLNAAYRRRQELATLITKVQSDASSLRVRLSAFTIDEPAVVGARNAVSRADALLPAAKDALAQLDGAGEDLYAALGDIEVQVAKMQFSVGPEFGSLITSLISQKIIVPSPLLQKPGNAKTSSSAENDLGPLTKEIEGHLSLVESILARFNAKAAAAVLQSCKVNLAAAGIAMKVDPASVGVQAGETVTALASGGVPSYSAVWHALAAPTDLVTYKVEPNGVISITAKPGAKTGTYTLMVVDGGKGRDSLTVNVGAVPQPATSTEATQKPKGPDTPAALCPNPSPLVKAVQEALVKEGIKTVKIKGVDQAVLIDGCQGPVTNEAMKQFYVQKQGLAEDAVEKDPARLLKEAASDLKATETASVTGTPKPACPAPSALVKAVQDALAKEGIKTVKVQGADQAVLADGCQGDITNEAIKEFYRKKNSGVTVEGDPATLLKKFVDDLKVTAKE